MKKYTDLTWEELLNRTKLWFDLPKVVTEALKRLKAVIDSNQGGVQSITGNLVDNTDPLNPIINTGSSRPYKVYTALLTQIGTNNPTIDILENTLTTPLTLTRLSVGSYLLAGTEAFPLDKTFIGICNKTNSSTLNLTLQQNNFDNSNILITTKNGTISSDNMLFKTPLEIRVYN